MSGLRGGFRYHVSSLFFLKSYRHAKCGTFDEFPMDVYVSEYSDHTLDLVSVSAYDFTVQC